MVSTGGTSVRPQVKATSVTTLRGLRGEKASTRGEESREEALSPSAFPKDGLFREVPTSSQ